MAVLGLWVINKAGGLVYQRNFNGGLWNDHRDLEGTRDDLT